MNARSLLPGSRAAAHAAGTKKYFTGRACKKGHFSPRYAKGGTCYECVKERAQRWYARNKEEVNQHRRGNPEINYKAHLKRAYGVTLNFYKSLEEAQHYRCAICGSEGPGGSNTHWCLDHCHSTQRVRGLLCARCNQMLGGARDNSINLLTAIDYLGGHTASCSAASAVLSMGS